MWAFLFLCVLWLNRGSSKKLQLFFFPVSVFTLQLQAASVQAGPRGPTTTLLFLLAQNMGEVRWSTFLNFAKPPSEQIQS